MSNRAFHATSWTDRPSGKGHEEHRVLRNLTITVAASAVVLAGLAGAQYLRTQTESTASTSTTAVQSYEAFEPGGSVYGQQVPALTAASYEAFVPGGSVYGQQVPEQQP